MRLLLAEDDAMIGAAVRDRLHGQGFAVDWVRDGRAADAALAGDVYDLLLLDLGLPGREGLAVLKALRGRGSTLPVVIVTARDAVDDRVAGLDAGADDYVVKPFDLKELEARLRAVLRRRAGSASSVIEHGRLSLDLAAGVRLAARAARASGPHPLARPAGGASLRLGRGGRQQRRRGAHPLAAPEARSGPDP